MAKRGDASSHVANSSDSETLLTIARLIRDGSARARADICSEQDTETASASTGPGLLLRLLDALPVGVLLAEARRTVLVNEAFALAFGYSSPEEVLTAGGLEAVFPAGGDVLAPEAGGANGKGKKTRLEGRSRSGRVLDISLIVHELAAPQEKPLRLLVLTPFERPVPDAVDTSIEAPAPPVANDERASQQTVQARLGEAAGDRTDFLAKVSHEVRTPLNSIIGFSELMKEERLGPVGNDRYRSYIRDIHESGLYALSLINDLLDISKIDSGNFEINFTAVDLEDLVADCLHVMQPQAQSARVVLRMSMTGPLPRVLADSRAMKQVLLNLLSNAIKFTEAGGQVIISTRAMDTGEVRLRVRDTGVGMSGSEIEQAMRPFRQLDTAPRKQVGTGLGLPLTKALAEANRATFRLSSTSGAGTTIDIVFAPDRIARPVAGTI